MDTATTIRQMIMNNKIRVPDYQRAYSWETRRDGSYRMTHTDVFLSDLEEHLSSKARSAYYFGHFLFEEKHHDIEMDDGSIREDQVFYVIDGQQRLTTIEIFLSALFRRISDIRALSEYETVSREDLLKRNSTYRFSTVQYDRDVFEDYVIDGENRELMRQEDIRQLETESARRIVFAFNYFVKALSKKEPNQLTGLLEVICKASCTTHVVTKESDAIQMFIFQNNRGKRPSNLEIIKAQFMYNTHLYGGDKRHSLIEEITRRFETIYKSIASIEANIDEDDVLRYSAKIHFNSLIESNFQEKILSLAKDVDFVQKFTQELASSFHFLRQFCADAHDERDDFVFHSLVSLGDIAFVYPFVIKAYKFRIEKSEKQKLCTCLEKVLVRDRLVGTRADINSRFNEVFIGFTEVNNSIEPILKLANDLKTTSDWWWGYWNNNKLESALQGALKHPIARFIMWRYENYLLAKEADNSKQSGYPKKMLRYDDIEDPELEHIAP
jgi:hypothetical protein